MKYLIVGLGNIGTEYIGTRHNIGFQILDSLIKEKDIAFTSARLADIAQLKIKGRQVVLIKPTTYMNLSGKAVRYWMDKENIPIENVLIICDDIALPFGVFRMRKKGGDGGHNGLTDIIQQLGSDNFARLRFGLGNDFPKGRQVEFVLGKWSTDENKVLEERLKLTEKMIVSFVFAGVERTMTDFNNK